MISSKYAITNTSSYALRLLHRPPAHGTVHSVYRKTVNLLLRGELLALQAARSPLSPISLISALDGAQMNALAVSPGDPVAVREDGILMIGDCLFDMQNAAVQELDLMKNLQAPCLSPTDCAHLKENIRRALGRRDAGSFELLFTAPARAAEIPFLQIAGKKLGETTQLLRLAGNSPASESERADYWEDSAAVLRSVIGLGLGLTPGGDDFLCGVLAGLILAGRRAHPFGRALAAQIGAHLTDTNDISAAFLRCALCGQFSLAVNSLLQLPSDAEILSTFSEIGHSSGTDTLCGIYFALGCAEFL